MTILVTGGAGYIGSHVVRLLLEANEKVVIVDDLSTGYPDRNPSVPIVEFNLADVDATEKLIRTFQQYDVDSVIHFAARKQVGESVEQPMYYYDQNVNGMRHLLDAMQSTAVDVLVFSSSAAVYGMPDLDIVDEKTPCEPINPYGETKLINEWMSRDAARAWGLKFVALRYFNVAGAGHPDLGDKAALNLIPMVMERIERGEAPRIFGDTYPTSDGTCIRDYIHVQDLAEAHIAALEALRAGPLDSDVLNVGTGRGSSVREMVDQIIDETGTDLEAIVEPPRAGDPARLVAATERMTSTLGWNACHDVRDMIRSAWEAWQGK